MATLVGGEACPPNHQKQGLKLIYGYRSLLPSFRERRLDSDKP